MRKQFAQILHQEMSVNDNIYLITADLGYGLWDNIQQTFPGRFFNVGSSEMTMMGTAIGLAMENKKPFVYSITPFAIYRPFEMIRNYLDYESIDVTIVGGGRDKDYGYLGFSHWAHDDRQIMSCFSNIKTFHPVNEDELQENFTEIISKQTPSYLNLVK
jgi:transketolase